MTLYDDDKEKMELMVTEGEGDEIEKPKDTDINNEDLDAASVIGKRTMEVILMNLNSYWIELIGSITLCISIIIYEIIGIFIVMFLYSIFQMIAPTDEEGNFVDTQEDIDPGEVISATIDLVFYRLGLKWFIFINICQHMSVGFFCLTTFSNVFRETRNVKKFLICTTIKVLIFYGLTEFILQFIIRYLIGEKILKDAIEEVRKQDFLEDDEQEEEASESEICDSSTTQPRAKRQRIMRCSKKTCCAKGCEKSHFWSKKWKICTKCHKNFCPTHVHLLRHHKC